MTADTLIGGTAGSIGIFIGYPFDIVKVKLQIHPDRYQSAWSCFTQILIEDGVLGLYRGCLLPLMMQGRKLLLVDSIV